MTENAAPLDAKEAKKLRTMERNMRWAYLSAAGGSSALIGAIAFNTIAWTDPGIRASTAWAMTVWSAHLVLAWLWLYSFVRRLTKDRNFWRKSATHDMDQIMTMTNDMHAEIRRKMNEGDGWKEKHAADD